MAYYFLKVLSAFFCLLPRSLAYAMGRALGVILYPFIPKKRKELAFRQIKMCLPVSDEEARRIARASAVRFGPMLVEVLRFPLIKRHPEDYIRIENIEPMKAVMAGGKGCIIAAYGRSLCHGGHPDGRRRHEAEGLGQPIHQRVPRANRHAYHLQAGRP